MIIEIEKSKRFTPKEKYAKIIKYNNKCKRKNTKLFHKLVLYKERFINHDWSIEKIKEKLILTKKARYFYDKDKKQRTTRCRFMSEKDIEKIVHLSQELLPWPLS